jgi:hypothetical protein
VWDVLCWVWTKSNARCECSSLSRNMQHRPRRCSCGITETRHSSQFISTRYPPGGSTAHRLLAASNLPPSIIHGSACNEHNLLQSTAPASRYNQEHLHDQLRQTGYLVFVSAAVSCDSGQLFSPVYTVTRRRDGRPRNQGSIPGRGINLCRFQSIAMKPPSNGYEQMLRPRWGC